MKPTTRSTRPQSSHASAVLRIPRLASIAAWLLVLMTLGMPSPQPASAAGVVMAPEGGRLDAVDASGHVVGPCPLEHTDVRVDVTGHISRVTLTQRYRNTYEHKIEAVYTFPISHRAAVDRMIMRVGERVVVGEVKKRDRARMIYEAARAAGYVASLLDQERPNIFTQSVANIEPGAEVSVEISYVELVESKDGWYRFEFPMVVGPRYIPAGQAPRIANLPAGFAPRRGLVLLAPPRSIEIAEQGDVDKLGTLQPGKLQALLAWAQPIATTSSVEASPLWYAFIVRYHDGAIETGTFHTNGTGQLNGRAFRFDPAVIEGMGTGFSPDTDQVPDASRITPMPARPGTRAGHDISITVAVETGGPEIVEYVSELHDVAVVDDRRDRLVLQLTDRKTIPNRDFVLTWRTSSNEIEESIFTHHPGPKGYGEFAGGFVTLILQPPDRIDDDAVLPRELVFVMDVSGSMSGLPIEKSKEVMRRALDAMRPDDRFNVITFAGRTAILWKEPRPATESNREEARAFVDMQRGGGGTEMMKAIRTALVQKRSGWWKQHWPGEKAGPAPLRICMFLTDGYVGNDMAIIDAVRANAKTTRVFSFGIGNSANRYLLDGMARAGRGDVEYVLLDSDADAAVERFTRRIQTPVLTDIEVEFGGGLAVHDVLPGTAAGEIPDLFDVKPLVIHGRYTKPGRGTVTIRGFTAAGPYRRVLRVELPSREPAHDVIATLWARQRVESLMNRDLAAAQAGAFPADLREDVVSLGESFQIMTQYTSFVAVEKSRVTLGGKPVLVTVPIEMPEGVSWEGVFGEILEDEDVIDVGEWSGHVPAEESKVEGVGFLDGAQRLIASSIMHRSKAPSPGVAGASTMSPPAMPNAQTYTGPSPQISFGLVATGLNVAAGVKVVGGYRGIGGIAGEVPERADREALKKFDLDFAGHDTEPAIDALSESFRQAKRSKGSAGDGLRRVLMAHSARPVLSARIATWIAELVEEGDLDLAVWLAEELAACEPGFEIGVAMRNVLSDKTIDERERTQQIRALDAWAQALLERHQAVAARRATLKRVIDERLWVLVPELSGAVPPSGARDGAALHDDEKGWLYPDGSISIVVLVTSVDDEILAALRGAGLTIEDRSESARLVVGTIASGAALSDFALLEPVRRLEPVTGS